MTTKMTSHTKPTYVLIADRIEIDKARRNESLVNNKSLKDGFTSGIKWCGVLWL